MIYKNIDLNLEEQYERSQDFLTLMTKRRSIRSFSDKDVPKKIIENIIMTASKAPSGANKQPWAFCAVQSKTLKQKIRQAAEDEEYKNYHSRMSQEWLTDLEVFETDWHKPFLEVAPWLIVLFKQVFEYEETTNNRKNNYYVNESVGIAAGFLITAIHYAGLVTLTHTPSPMNFLQKILKRPDNERAFLLLPVGYPADSVSVPEISKKMPDKIITYL